MTLLTICTDAIKADGRFQVPTTIVGNADPTAVQLLSLANLIGKTLAYDFAWNVLLTNYTFATVSSTATYALPSDFKKFSNLTFWDRSNTTKLIGPANPTLWETLKSGIVSGGSEKYFRIAGNLFTIHPTPTAIETIAYQYFSNYWITGKAAFSLDADEPLIDADLITLGIRYRFLRAKGLPFDLEMKEFNDRRDSMLAADGAKGIISFGRITVSPYEGIPDSNFG